MCAGERRGAVADLKLWVVVNAWRSSDAQCDRFRRDSFDFGVHRLTEGVDEREDWFLNRYVDLSLRIENQDPDSRFVTRRK
jgi:hypothetical protein